MLVPSPRDVASYDLKPQMSAAEVAGEVVRALPDGFGFCVVNFANPDMVGHTGVIPAVVRAVEAADAALGRVVEATLALGGVCLVTADHGNAEQMLEADGVSPHTAHTTNPVPLVVTAEPTSMLRDGGGLADLAPTILTLLGQPVPAAMTGVDLVVAVTTRIGDISVSRKFLVCKPRYGCMLAAHWRSNSLISGSSGKPSAATSERSRSSFVPTSGPSTTTSFVSSATGRWPRILTQEVFLRVYQGLPGFSLRSRFTTWLFQVTKNRVLDELRSIERRPRSVVYIDDIAPLESLDAPFERAETIDALWRSVEALNVDLKMALLLRDIVGLSYTEISDSLEITLATVKWRIYKAREEVQAALVRDGVGVATSSAGALSTITE